MILINFLSTEYSLYIIFIRLDWVSIFVWSGLIHLIFSFFFDFIDISFYSMLYCTVLYCIELNCVALNCLFFFIFLSSVTIFLFYLFIYYLINIYEIVKQMWYVTDPTITFILFYFFKQLYVENSIARSIILRPLLQEINSVQRKMVKNSNFFIL